MLIEGKEKVRDKEREKSNEREKKENDDEGSGGATGYFNSVLRIYDGQQARH